MTMQPHHPAAGAYDDPGAPVARDPRREAQALVGDHADARVLEPSPPTVTEPPWFADDPVQVDPAGARRAAPVVSPVTNGDLTWQDWLRDRPEHGPWAAARWLGDYRRLPSLPDGYLHTRLALHRVAVYVVAPARRRVNGKIGLRWTFGGFGTPFFGADEQVRIAGDRLVRQRGAQAEARNLTSLDRAAEFVLDGPPDLAWAEGFDVPPPGDLHGDLPIDPDAAAFLGNWYGFATSVLETLRAEQESAEPSRLQLWPEHFDIAFEALGGSRRAVFGASPGDAAEAEPYLYVLPFDFPAVPDGAWWNAESFRGAILRLGEFAEAADQRAAALAFLREGRALLLS